MDYILTWSNGFGKVSSGEYLFDLASAPELSFEFDALYYETPTNLAFKVIGDEQIALTEEETALCKDYCDRFLEEADYPVEAYETDSALYRGTMLKSEALEKEYPYVIGDVPDHPVSKRVGDAWVRIAALIRSNGSYVLMPDSVCDACVLFFTAEEWEAHSKPARSTEHWDFATETWKDYRTLEEAKKEADSWIRSLYTARRVELMGSGPYQELASWPWQIDEAKAWNTDHEASTPFIDAMLAEMNTNEATATTKESLVASILKYTSPEWLAKIGTVHGEMYVQISLLRHAETLAEVDAITDELAKGKEYYYLTYPLSFVVEDGVARSEQRVSQESE